MHNEFEKAADSLSAWWEQAGVEGVPIAPKSHNKPRGSKPVAPRKAPLRQSSDPPKAEQLALAKQQAAQCQNLDELTAAIRGFDVSAIFSDARQAVISRGNPKASVMLIGEAPGQDEDKAGQPFVGRSGQFLDKMFANISLDESSLYITNAVFWRPKGNRTPNPEQAAVCLPFVERHIEIIQPQIIVTIGGSSTKALLKIDTGITRLRGRWQEYVVKKTDNSETGMKIPLLPMFHPAFVLRKPFSKRECWLDLLSLQEKLEYFKPK